MTPTPTKNDLFRLLRKRDESSQWFVVVKVEGNEVTLSDLALESPDLVVSDLTPYKWIGNKKSRRVIKWGFTDWGRKRGREFWYETVPSHVVTLPGDTKYHVLKWE